ncbi:hypothetical protein ACFWOJ_12370 [Streptomyces sp. NPDC058439]
MRGREQSGTPAVRQNGRSAQAQRLLPPERIYPLPSAIARNLLIGG